MFYKLSFFALLFFTSCSSIERESIIIDNKNHIISLNSTSDYVIDSISIRKNENNILSISLDDKIKGDSKIFLTKKNDNYKVFVNRLNEVELFDENLELLLILRKKGSSVIVTNSIANGIVENKDIQILRGYRFLPHKKIDTLEADIHFR